MKLYFFIFSLVLHAVNSNIVFSQKKDITKLLLSLAKKREDTARINIVNGLSYKMAAVKNIRLKSNVNDHFEDISLPVETRRNIYLLFKEAINNALKYSNACLLELYVKEQDNEIEISLKDDGTGLI